VPAARGVLMKLKDMKKRYKENLVKNILLIILLVLLYSPIQSYILRGGLVSDKTSAGSILIAVSIIAILAAFGNFEFKYDKVNLNKTAQRYFAHIITGILMFVMGVSMIMTGILISLIMGHFVLIDITLLLLYIACIGYDFWDLVSGEK
jgi:hypothetical protein